MPRRIAEKDLQAIINVVTSHDEGLSAQQIYEKLGHAIALRTLQYRLKYLIGDGRLVQKGKARATQYLPPESEVRSVPHTRRASHRHYAAVRRDVFIWVYRHSAARHFATRQSLGEPDPLRFRYRNQFHEVIHRVICDAMGRKDAVAHIAKWTDDNIVVDDRKAFRETAEVELLSLHEGNFARYHVKLSEFQTWQKAWSKKPLA